MDSSDFADMVCSAMQEFENHMNGIANIYSGHLRDIESRLQHVAPDASSSIIRTADLLATGTLDLSLEQSPESMLRVLLDDKPSYYLLSILLAHAKAAERLVYTMGVDTDRVGSLSEVIATASPSYNTLLFLKRVSLCYILRLDSECITMSRAALEAELTATISPDECIERFGIRTRYHGEPVFDLYERMLVARDNGRITTEAFDAANRVRDTANRVLHRAPTNKDSLSVVRDCLTVISELAPTNAR